MKNKILITFLIVTMMITLTGCGAKKQENTKENANTNNETKEEVKEETIDVSGSYYLYSSYEDSLYYDDYITLNDDGTFQRQCVYCAGVDQMDGTYYATKNDDKIKIEFKVTDYESLPITVELKDDKIFASTESYASSEGTYNAILNLISSCYDPGYEVEFHKDDSSKIKYREEVYYDIGPGY